MAQETSAKQQDPDQQLVAVREGKIGVPKMLVTVEQAEKMVQDFVELKRRVIMADPANYAIVKRANKRDDGVVVYEPYKFIRKGGWQLCDSVFGITHQLIEKYQEIHTEAGMFDAKLKIPHFTQHVRYRTILPDGRYVEHEGACSTMEKRFAGDYIEKNGAGKIFHDTKATAETRATNRGTSHAVGSGEASAEEVDDEGPAKPALTKEQEEARSKAKAMGKERYGCPHCQEDFASTVDLELHVHRDHPTKNAYPARKVLA